MTRCSPLCERNTKLKEKQKVKKRKRVVMLEEECCENLKQEKVSHASEHSN